jgi:hypothetical protein
MENYTLPPEVSTHFHFYLQSLKCDTLPPQTFKSWQFNPFGLFIPKMPPTFFFSKQTKFQKKKKTKQIYKIYAGVAEPPHRWWLATLFFVFLFLDFFF